MCVCVYVCVCVCVCKCVYSVHMCPCVCRCPCGVHRCPCGHEESVGVQKIVKNLKSDCDFGPTIHSAPRTTKGQTSLVSGQKRKGNLGVTSSNGSDSLKQRLTGHSETRHPHTYGPCALSPSPRSSAPCCHVSGGPRFDSQGRCTGCSTVTGCPWDTRAGPYTHRPTARRPPKCLTHTPQWAGLQHRQPQPARLRSV